MRAALAAALLLILVSGAHADLGDVDTSLGEVAFDEVQVSPDGSRLAFITRSNDLEQDREVSTVWRIDLGGTEPSRPIRLTEPGTYASLRWAPDSRSLSYLSPTAPDEAFQLFLLEMASGSAPRRVTDPARFANGIDLYDWLPDGTGFMVLARTRPTPRPWQPRPAGVSSSATSAGNPARSRCPPSIKVAREGGGNIERVAASPFETAQILTVSPDGRQAAVAGSSLEGGVEGTEVAILSLDPGAPPKRTRNLGWEETLAWAGKDLFVSVTGEEKGGRYTEHRGTPVPGDRGCPEPRPRRARPGGLPQAAGAAGRRLSTRHRQYLDPYADLPPGARLGR